MTQKLTARDVARLTGRSKSQVHRDAIAGRLRVSDQFPGYNGPRLFDKTDVLAAYPALELLDEEAS